jgi:hypothetical protein
MRVFTALAKENGVDEEGLVRGLVVNMNYTSEFRKGLGVRPCEGENSEMYEYQLG